MNTLACALAVLVALCGAAHAEWFTIASAGCIPASEAGFSSPKNMMDAFDSKGIKYTVEELPAGSDKPTVVSVKSTFYRSMGVPIDAWLFFRTRDTCEGMKALSKVWSDYQTDKYK